MRRIGRTFAVGIFLLLHTAYIAYYFIRDGRFYTLDLLGYPLIFTIAYWAGKQYDKAKFYSEKDALTNLYNRRYVLHTYNKYVSVADRSESKLYLLIIDCDNFKDINDQYGHTKGDVVLFQIANILLQSAHKNDVVARWGGDEFLMIGHYRDDMDILIQNIHHELAKLSKQTNLSIKVSIGSTIYPDNGKSIDELIRVADHRMYTAKSQK